MHIYVQPVENASTGVSVRRRLSSTKSTSTDFGDEHIRNYQRIKIDSNQSPSSKDSRTKFLCSDSCRSVRIQSQAALICNIRVQHSSQQQKFTCETCKAYFGRDFVLRKHEKMQRPGMNFFLFCFPTTDNLISLLHLSYAFLLCICGFADKFFACKKCDYAARLISN